VRERRNSKRKERLKRRKTNDLNLYFLPPRHLLPWSMSEEEDDAQEELLLSKNQQMYK
jgi:hypothetical protein